jgi:hypothetical protein
VVDADLSYARAGEDISCNLGSLAAGTAEVSTGIPGLTVGFVGPVSGDLVAAAASSIKHSPLRSS